MEPERKIEKLLRAFAKKRREQAGDPLELHPANRRLLQGEIARQFRKTQARGAWLGFLVKPQWIAALSVIALLGVLVLLLLPALNKSKREAEYAATRSEPVRMRSMSEESVAVPANGSVATTASSAVNLSENRAEKDKQAGSAKVAPLVAPETPALARQDSPKQPAGTASLYFNSSNRADESLASANAGTLQDSSKTLSVNASTAALSGELAKKQSEAGRPLDQLSGQKFKAISNQPPVLAAFEVLRDGSEIRIVDSDGSVYRGVMREPASALGVSDRLRDSVQTKTGSVNSSARYQQIELATGSIFQVTGTNRTLNQNVTLQGEFSFATNQIQSTSTLGGAVGGSGGGIQLLPIGSLRGTVTVGNGKSIPFQAAPAASTNR